MICRSYAKAYDISIFNTWRCGDNLGAGIRHWLEEEDVIGAKEEVKPGVIGYLRD